MPGPKPRPKANQYPERFSTQGQRVSNDGSEVIMSNGRRFKRTILPSSAAIQNDDILYALEEDKETTGEEA